MSKDVQEVIRDAPFGRKALFLGMQFTGFAGLASIAVACIAPPISLAVAGAGVALFTASFAGQAIFLSQEAKRQAKEEDTEFLARKYSPKTNKPSKPSRNLSQQKVGQKQVPKVQAPGVKHITPSIRISAAELKRRQRGRGPREI